MQKILDSRGALVAVGIVLVAVLLGAQFLGNMTAPPSGVSSTGRSVGKAAFAYLGGLRTFAAAVLWNRLDGQYDNYFEGVHFKDVTFIMPTIFFVTKLDPNFVQAYYVGGYLLAERGMWDEAYKLAGEGIANNPNSGLVRASYVQILLRQDKKKNLAAALKQARIGVGPGMYYSSIDDEFEAIAIFRSVFNLVGDRGVVAAIMARQRQLYKMGATGNKIVHASAIATVTP